MTAAKSLGSTKSSSASSSKSRAADASLSSSSGTLILYEIMFATSSVNSHQIYPIRPPRPTPNTLFPVKDRGVTLAPMARRRLKLIFGQSLVKEPVIYQLGRKFEI